MTSSNTSCISCVQPFSDKNNPFVCLQCGITRCGKCFESPKSFTDIQCPSCFSDFKKDELPINYQLLSNDSGGGGESHECFVCAEDIKHRFPQIFGCGHGMCKNCATKLLKLVDARQYDNEFYNYFVCQNARQYDPIEQYIEKRCGSINCPMCRKPISKIVDNKELYAPKYLNNKLENYQPILYHDLRNLANRLISQGLIPLDQIIVAIREYRKFMFLKKVVGDDNATILSPAPLVDVIWHSHILDTADYNKFCLLKIGFFVHHNPGGEFQIDEKRKRYRKTITEYIKYFGTPDYSSCDGTFPNPQQNRNANVVWFHDQLVLHRDENKIGTFIIKSINGKVREMPLHNNMMVWETKLYLRHREGLAIDDVRLIFGGKNMVDSKKLSEYGVVNDSQVHLMLKLRGC